MQLNGYDLAFPIMVGEESKPRSFDPRNQILGTAFYVGGGCLVTAGHVIQALQTDEETPFIAVSRPGREGVASATIIRDMEVLPHDVGVLRVNMNSERPAEPVVPWASGEVSALNDLFAIGFPYGLLPMADAHQILQRTFRGHAVSSPDAYELPTDAGRPAPVYELSFQAPRGLSGGPLYLVSSSKDVFVVGVVVGNSSQSMVVHNFTETDQSVGQTTVYQRHESLHMGVAIRSSRVLELDSRILGGSLAAHLARRKALIQLGE